MDNAEKMIDERIEYDLFSQINKCNRGRSAAPVAGAQQRRLGRARGGGPVGGPAVDTTPAIANTSRPPPLRAADPGRPETRWR
jgi:hypothetical protein